ncbi:Protein CBG27038 [Caenorhabditis briggsae]|uniref:Protein CBG27038 n=1 Tax=Caenorhabditis briggsae TaxID=6238 RepID=B6IMA2_CAEBR|nr:Protein CBG27038 [Caenorhabditis briggsae]CAS01032.1 Protein CBG27038 [Caenorhabditis briggsae]
MAQSAREWKERIVQNVWVKERVDTVNKREKT